MVQEGKYDVGASIRQFTGSSTEIQTLFATAGFKSSFSNNFHGLRVNLFSQKEGPYIANQRGYLNYAVSILLKEKAYLNLGSEIGFFSRVFSAPSALSAANSVVPDGKLALAFTNENNQIGLSLNQLFNNEGRPISSTFTLQRYAAMFVIKQVPLENEKVILFNYYGRVLKNLGYQHLSTIGIKFNDMYGFGAGHRTQGEFVLWGDLKFRVNKNILKTSIAMNLPYSTRRSSISNSVELALGTIF